MSEISRLRITTVSLPNSVERVAATSAATVVVLIPPPVPPGLAPMNINAISSSVPESVMFSSENGTVVKPAVRAVTDSNRAVIQRSGQAMPMNTSPRLSHSVTARPRVPQAISSTVVLSTSRVWRLGRRRPRRNPSPTRSLVTLQPSPPITISSITTALTTGFA